MWRGREHVAQNIPRWFNSIRILRQPIIGQIIIKLKLTAARAAAMASGSWDLTEMCQIINYKGDKNTNLRSGGVCRS